MILTTVIGRDIDLKNLPKLQPEEIFHPLSQICRFSGQCPNFFSVGQHTLNIYSKLKKKTDNPFILGQSLLHDATESFLSDMASPVKKELPDYRSLEQNLSKQIYRMFGYPENTHQSIKDLDKSMGQTEHAVFFDNACHDVNDFMTREIGEVKETLIRLFLHENKRKEDWKNT